MRRWILMISPLFFSAFANAQTANCLFLDGTYKANGSGLKIQVDAPNSAIHMIYTTGAAESSTYLTFIADGKSHGGDHYNTGNSYFVSCLGNQMTAQMKFDMGDLTERWVLENAVLSRYGSLNGYPEQLEGQWQKQ